jgi:hypothetical protein
MTVMVLDVRVNEAESTVMRTLYQTYSPHLALHKPQPLEKRVLCF